MWKPLEFKNLMKEYWGVALLDYNDGNIVVSNALRAYLEDEGVYIEATERTIIQGAI